MLPASPTGRLRPMAPPVAQVPSVASAPQSSTTVELFARDVRVRRSGGRGRRVGGGPRAAILGLSAASARNLSFTARNLAGLTVLATLTYPAAFPLDGSLVKSHWEKLRRWLAGQGLGGLWMLEFQERGAPHFHLLLNGPINKSRLALKWYQIVGSGDEQHLQAGTRVEAVRKPTPPPSTPPSSAPAISRRRSPAAIRMWGSSGAPSASSSVPSGSSRGLPRRWRPSCGSSGARKMPAVEPEGGGSFGTAESAAGPSSIGARPWGHAWTGLGPCRRRPSKTHVSYARNG